MLICDVCGGKKWAKPVEVVAGVRDAWPVTARFDLCPDCLAKLADAVKGAVNKVKPGYFVKPSRLPRGR